MRRHVGVPSGQYALRLQALRDRSPTACEHTSNIIQRHGVSYGGKEGILADLGKERAAVCTATGGDVLCQLVLRRVGFHELRLGAP